MKSIRLDFGAWKADRVRTENKKQIHMKSIILINRWYYVFILVQTGVERYERFQVGKALK